MASLTSQLIVSLVDNVSDAARRIGSNLSGISRTIRETNAQQLSLSERVDAAITRNNRALESSRGRMAESIGTFYALRAAISAPIESAKAFESTLAELGAKGDLSAGQLDSIGAAARQTGADVNQFAADIVKAQDFLVGMGLDVERSTKAMPAIGKAATATKADILDLSKAGFAAMTNLGVAAEDLGHAMDVMAQAGKDGGFELRDMSQYLPSITALASAKGMSGMGGLADIAAALQIVRRGAGDSSEAATNFMNVLQKINANDAAAKFAKAGIDINKVLKDAVANGASPLEAALKSVNQFIDGDLSKLGTLFNDAQVQKGLIPLLNGMEDYVALREKAGGAGGVIDADFARMMDTSAEQAKSFEVAMQNLKTGVGTSLLDAIGKINTALLPLVQTLGDLVDRHPRVTAALLGITAGFIALKAAVNAGQFLALTARGGVLSALSFSINTVGASLLRLKGGASEMIRLQSALAAMQGINMTGWQSFVAGLRGMMLAIPGMSGITAVITGIVGAIGAISAPIWLAIAAAVLAVGAAWKYWDRISAIISGVASAIGEQLRPVFDWLGEKLGFMEPVLTAASDAFGLLGTALGGVVDAVGALFSGIFSQEVLTDEDKARISQSTADMTNRILSGFGSLATGLYQAGADAIQALWDGMKAVFDRLIAWVNEKVAALTAPFKGILGSFSDPAAAAKSATPPRRSRNARARGGPVSRGSTYTVGEKGPELITASRSGYVNPTGSGTSGPSITVAPSFTFNAMSAADAGIIEAQVRRTLHDEVQEMFRGVYADAGMRFA
ncbi:phage tail tape measure protein [Aquibium sp. ELW1220]|uniref:phage tail tape measure protein n=1 Tax=Aquibium sp. ELW1220 TaxID=2976766 RepID=UPI0025AF56A8|nr:phage tail tape measure protein [Aquibium sp. ELW1220]MDN2578953.1 phage tail tape measure protein [Aquibium sp. ELW1220]